MKNKTLLIVIPLIIHLIIIVMGSIAIISQAFLSPGSNNAVSVSGVNIFRYFTIDGNIFIILASIVISIFLILKKESKISYLLHLMAAVSALLIFITVVIVLLPYFGSMLLHGYKMIVLHATNPMLCVISFLFFYKDKISKKMAILGILPMAVYGFFAMLFCFTKVWSGSLIPYPFLEVYDNPWYESLLYIVGMFGGSILTSILLSIISRKLYIVNMNKKGLIITGSILFLVIIGMILLLVLI